MSRDLPTRVHHVSRRRGRALGVFAAGVLVSALALTACTPPAPTPSPSSSTTHTSSGTPSDTPSPTPTAPPVLIPEGTAADNLPLFAAVTADIWATDARVSGRAYIDALVAVGFDKAAMQVTSDQSTVGNPAETIQFAVRWGDECLIGQVGPATGDPVTVVVPVLAEGACLVGKTRPIDW